MSTKKNPLASTANIGLGIGLIAVFLVVIVISDVPNGVRVPAIVFGAMAIAAGAWILSVNRRRN